MALQFSFEVFGRVQGVFFRKYTQAEGRKLGVVGYVRNTDSGSVVGLAQSLHLSNLLAMQSFLKSKGSPKSKIEKAEFQPETGFTEIDKLTYDDFIIKR